jgi:subtilisin family serine protease
MGGGTSTFFGTSQATPLAAACAAALLEADPSATPDDIEAALETSPTQLTDPKNGLAFPRLDCEAALAALLPPAHAVPALTGPGGSLLAGLLLAAALVAAAGRLRGAVRERLIRSRGKHPRA